MAKKDKDSDLALVRRVKKGEYSAFDLLVLKYQSRVIAISTKYVKDFQLAEDIAQESFFKAYKSIDSFREESAFYTWLYRITANTAINYLSSKKRKSELLEADVSLNVAKNFIENVKPKALGKEIIRSTSPGQMVVKIVHDELVKLLGE